MADKKKVIRALRSKFWKHNGRLQQAATTAFRSMKIGRDQGTEALDLLQSALRDMDGRAGAKVIPPNEPEYYRRFGPYNWGDEATGPGRCYFGPNTENAVRDFQAKIPQELAELEADGIAGIATLRELDDYLLFYFDGKR